MKTSVNKLIKYFDNRPPGIYKADYLYALYERMENDGENAPPAPELPDWCNGIYIIFFLFHKC